MFHMKVKFSHFVQPCTDQLSLYYISLEQCALYYLQSLYFKKISVISAISFDLLLQIEHCHLGGVRNEINFMKAFELL